MYYICIVSTPVVEKPKLKPKTQESTYSSSGRIPPPIKELKKNSSILNVFQGGDAILFLFFCQMFSKTGFFLLKNP